MDEPRPSVSKALLFCGIALLLLAVIGQSPSIPHAVVEERMEGEESSMLSALHRGSALVMGLMAVGMIVFSRLPRRLPRSFMSLTFLVLVIGPVTNHAVYLFRSSHFDPFVLCYVLASLLLNPGAALIWGTALARRMDPTSGEIQQAGRIGAGLAQLGFMFIFIAELRTFSNMGNGGEGGTAASLIGLNRIVALADRLLLLWASIETVRTAPEPAVVAARALKIHKLMLGWLGAMLVGVTLNVALRRVTSGHWIASNLWISASFIAVSVSAVVVVLRRYAPGYKSPAPGHP